MSEQPKTCAPCRSGHHARCLGCACAHTTERAFARLVINPFDPTALPPGTRYGTGIEMALRPKEAETASQDFSASEVRNALEVLGVAGYSVYAPDGEHVVWGESDQDLRGAHGDWTWTVDRVVKIVDPDTFDLVLSRPYERDLGFGMHVRGRDVAGPMRFRLLGIDAPETHKEPERARAALEFVDRWMFGGDRNYGVSAITHKPTERPLPDGAFGRWRVDLYDVQTGERLADAMRAAGHYKGASA